MGSSSGRLGEQHGIGGSSSVCLQPRKAQAYTIWFLLSLQNDLDFSFTDLIFFKLSEK